MNGKTHSLRQNKETINKTAKVLKHGLAFKYEGR